MTNESRFISMKSVVIGTGFAHIDLFINQNGRSRWHVELNKIRVCFLFYLDFSVADFRLRIVAQSSSTMFNFSENLVGFTHLRGFLDDRQQFMSAVEIASVFFSAAWVSSIVSAVSETSAQ